MNEGWPRWRLPLYHFQRARIHLGEPTEPFPGPHRIFSWAIRSSRSRRFITITSRPAHPAMSTVTEPPESDPLSAIQTDWGSGESLPGKTLTASANKREGKPKVKWAPESNAPNTTYFQKNLSIATATPYQIGRPETNSSTCSQYL